MFGMQWKKVKNDLQEYWAELPSVGFLKLSLELSLACQLAL